MKVKEGQLWKDLDGGITIKVIEVTENFDEELVYFQDIKFEKQEEDDCFCENVDDFVSLYEPLEGEEK
jgi:hypothetical protein